MKSRIARRFLERHASLRTLYHGTLREHQDSIKHFGLWGSAGDFVQWAYHEYGSGLPEVVYAADKQGLSKAVTAMAHHIGKKLGKHFTDVTDEEIQKYGMLVKFIEGVRHFTQRPDFDSYDEHPISAEPGDYYAESAWPDEYLTGNAMIRVLKRYGAWPRDPQMPFLRFSL